MGKMTDALRKAKLLKGQKEAVPETVEHPGAPATPPQAASRSVEVKFPPSPASPVAPESRQSTLPHIVEEEPDSSAAPAALPVMEAPSGQPPTKRSSVLPDVEPRPEPAAVETPTRTSVLPEIESAPVETASPYLIVHDKKDDRVADEFRLLKNALTANGSTPRVVLVVSSGPGEGKTTLAMNLAASFANTFGEKVVLVDGNILRPKIGDVLALPGEGLVQTVRGRIPPEEAVVKTDIPGLWALSAGGSEERSEGLLDSKSLAQVLQQLRSRFTRVIMELPSTADAPEGLALVSQADVILVPVMKNRTRRKSLRRFLQAIKEHGGKRVSCVFLRV